MFRMDVDDDDDIDAQGLPPLSFNLLPVDNFDEKTQTFLFDDVDDESGDRETENLANNFNLVNAVHDAKDKTRGQRLVDDIHAQLDSVSADDMVVEKSMLVKWLVSRYKNKMNDITKPMDLMFAIIECLCTGLKFYLSTERGDCSYVDHIEIYNGDIFCPTAEWILGVICDRRVKDFNRFGGVTAAAADVDDDDDEYGADPQRLVDKLIESWLQSKNSSSDLPPLFCYDANEVAEMAEATRTEKLIEQEKRLENMRVKNDIDTLEKKYSSLLNVKLLNDTMAVGDRSCLPCNAADLQMPDKYENVLKLIIDMKELQLLLTYLLYVDRESLNGDIDITFKNKPGTGKSFCSLKQAGLSQGAVGKCLQTTKNEQLKDVYNNLTGDRADDIDSTPADATREEEHTDSSTRLVQVFEYVTFLFLDKLQISTIEALFVNPASNKKNPYKFGLLDVISPKIGKLTTTSRGGDLRELPNNVNKRRRQRGVVLEDLD